MIEMYLDQIKNKNESKQQINKGIYNHYFAWKYIFNSFGVNEQDEYMISYEETLNDFSSIANLIFFIYSLESFVAYNLNKAEK